MTDAHPKTPVSALSVADVMQSVGISRTTLYNEINAGRLKSFKVGRRRMVSPAALKQWVEELEAAAEQPRKRTHKRTNHA